MPFYKRTTNGDWRWLAFNPSIAASIATWSVVIATEIARAVGFNGSSYYAETFKKVTYTDKTVC